MSRIGAPDIAEAIAERIGSPVPLQSVEFLSADADRVHCWYMNSSGEGPAFGVTLQLAEGGWTLQLNEFPPGTEKTVEVL